METNTEQQAEQKLELKGTIEWSIILTPNNYRFEFNHSEENNMAMIMGARQISMGIKEDLLNFFKNTKDKKAKANIQKVTLTEAGLGTITDNTIQVYLQNKYEKEIAAAQSKANETTNSEAVEQSATEQPGDSK